MVDAGFFELGDALEVRLKEEVVFAAGDPEEFELCVGFKGIVEGFGDGVAFGDPGGEGADIGKGVEFVEADREGMATAHGEAGDGAIFAAGV